MKERKKNDNKRNYSGLKFTVDMFLFDPGTGETFTEPRNDMDKITIDACKGAIELLEQTRWIPVGERLPNFNDIVLASTDSDYDELRVILTVYSAEEFWFNGKIKAWMPLPKPYKEGKNDLYWWKLNHGTPQDNKMDYCPHCGAKMQQQ